GRVEAAQSREAAAPGQAGTGARTASAVDGRRHLRATEGAAWGSAVSGKGKRRPKGITITAPAAEQARSPLDHVVDPRQMALPFVASPSRPQAYPWMPEPE